MGTEFKKDNIIETSPEDDNIMLPEGYGTDDDIFADPQNWTGKQADEPAGQPGDGEDSKGDGAEDAPTTAQETAQDVSGNDNAETPTTESTAPTTAQGTAVTAPNMLKFKAKYNSQEQDVELNESDLPGIWQKAQNHDRMQSRFNEQQELMNNLQQLAKRLGYSDAKEMAEKAAGAFQEAEVKNLMDQEGVSERVAKAIVAQEMQSRTGNAPQPQAQAASAQRNTQAEVNELLTAKPQLRGQQLPPEVIAEWGGGKNLLLAYTEYENRKAAAETARLQQENNIHKQNAANAAKAPVKGVASGGATDTKGDDDFLRGLKFYD